MSFGGGGGAGAGGGGGGGTATTVATFDQSGAVALDVASQDRTGNPCTAAGSVDVDADALGVAFSDPVASGVVGPSDGSLAPGGQSLALPVCGVVSDPGLSVDVTVDGGSPIAAQVTGTGFCTPSAVVLSASPPAHSIAVRASDGQRVGAARVDLVVDLRPPFAPGGLALVGLDRQSLRADFVAPGDGESQVASYLVKVAAQPLTGSNFDSIGTTVPAPAPAPEGQAQSLDIARLRAGTPYYVGAVAVDAGGNRSSVVTAGPVVLDFDRSGAIAGGASGGELAHALAAGELDGATGADLAVGAPTETGVAGTAAGAVHIYSGGAEGIGAVPALSLAGGAAQARFGRAVAVLDWNGDGQRDLAVGAPGADGGNGRVLIFLGPLGGGPAAPDVTVSVGATSVLLAGGALGTSLAVADVDGDARDDLVLGAPGAEGGRGAVAVLFGGASGGAALALDETDPAGPAALAMLDPGGLVAGGFGAHVFGLGPTLTGVESTDDIGVAYRDQNAAFVLRGRARPAAGLSVVSLDPARDLEIDNDARGDTTTQFGTAMTSFEDQDGDGTRELVVAAWRQGADRGRVVVVRGGLTGVVQARGSAVLTTINAGTATTKVGVALADTRGAGAPDVNNDGQEDLVLLGDTGRLTAFVVYGPLPAGTLDTGAADDAVVGPASFLGNLPLAAGLPGSLIWTGDVNGDGLDDLAYGDPQAGGVGAFEVLWDQRP